MASLFLTAAFGQSQTGLSTVGYTVKNRAGEVVSPRSQSGVVELGNGVYGAEFSLADNAIFLVFWDTGTASPRTAYNQVDTYPDGGESGDFSTVVTELETIRREVQGLKEKNIRKTPDNPQNPTRIDVAVKKDEASSWAPANLQEQYSISLATNTQGEVERYGG